MKMFNKIAKMLGVKSEEEKLYEVLNAARHDPYAFRVENLGEGMRLINESLFGYWKPRFLLDDDAKCAYEFMDQSEILKTVTLDDIDWESLKPLDEECINRAKRLYIHYPSFIFSYENGVAEVRWQLNPDGMYFMDEDGFGMTDDVEVNIYGMVDRKGKVLVKFRYIGEDWGQLKKMRQEAERMVE